MSWVELLSAGTAAFGVAVGLSGATDSSSVQATDQTKTKDNIARFMVLPPSRCQRTRGVPASMLKAAPLREHRNVGGG
jgi:hypothetical protein